MSINATTSSSVSSSGQVSASSSAESAKKTDSSSSFKDEMDKVSSEKAKNEVTDKKADDTAEKKNTEDNAVKDTAKLEDDDENKDLSFNGQVEYDKFASMSLLDANSMLTNDIRQVVNSSTLQVTSGLMSTDEIQKTSGDRKSVV